MHCPDYPSQSCLLPCYVILALCLARLFSYECQSYEGLSSSPSYRTSFTGKITAAEAPVSIQCPVLACEADKLELSSSVVTLHHKEV
ncbi:hypothetical protein F5B22DRAFT_623461, partial [Xylaria bambusicola]|uniref:uncharacterized protein n=1 Tax=Xylaria bambusicola TaxID=326684 RepID=UPI0020074428